MALEAKTAEHWKETFLELGRQLSIAVEQLVVEEGSLVAREPIRPPSKPAPLTLKAMAP